MSRPIRIEFPDALYHVTARGDRREDIFDDDQDRLMFLSTLEQAVKQFNWICHAWCLMDNLAQFAKQRSLAQRRYAQFVAEGSTTASPWSAIKGQVFLMRRAPILTSKSPTTSGCTLRRWDELLEEVIDAHLF